MKKTISKAKTTECTLKSRTKRSMVSTMTRRWHASPVFSSTPSVNIPCHLGVWAMAMGHTWQRKCHILTRTSFVKVAQVLGKLSGTTIWESGTTIWKRCTTFVKTGTSCMIFVLSPMNGWWSRSVEYCYPRHSRSAPSHLTILYYSTLHYAVLHQTTLYCTIPYHTTWHYTVLYYNYTILYYTILYYTILYYTILYYTILYYIIIGLWLATAGMEHNYTKYSLSLIMFVPSIFSISASC